MDRETEKRLDRLEAKLDKLTKLVEASADPRLVASTQGKDALKQATGGEKSKGAKFDVSKAPDRASPQRGGD